MIQESHHSDNTNTDTETMKNTEVLDVDIYTDKLLLLLS